MEQTCHSPVLERAELYYGGHCISTDGVLRWEGSPALMQGSVSQGHRPQGAILWTETSVLMGPTT